MTQALITSSRAGELVGLGDREIPHDTHGRPSLAGRTWDTAGRLATLEAPLPRPSPATSRAASRA